MDPTEWGYTPVSVNNRNDIILSAKEEANKQKARQITLRSWLSALFLFIFSFIPCKSSHKHYNGTNRNWNVKTN